jgi:solute:Na+ symporter, SSS family
MLLGNLDIVVLLASVAVAIAVGVRASKKTDSVEAFFLGDRDLPWWAILGSIVATETSTATVLSVPATAFGVTGMRFLQLAIGYVAGRLIVAYFLLPLFFDGRIVSAYEVLGLRFGERAKRVASLLFLVTRNLGDGLRLYLAAVVLKQMMDWPFAGSALAIGGVTILYTYFGGMRSVVWNDCIQLVIYMLGGVATLFIVAANVPGGWTAIWEFANETERLTVFQFAPPATPENQQPFLSWLISDPFSFWAGLFGGGILTLGTHGTDQMMVQRYLSARSQTDAARAIVLSGLTVLVQFALFLFIGVQLACFYSLHPEITLEKPDYCYAYFIIHHFPQNTGLVGLMLAAILAAAMSTLSSSLNSSASALLNDFYLPIRKAATDPQQLLKLTRLLAAGFGLLQVGIGIWATTFNSTVVNNALSIAGYSAGLLLGLFALGVLTKSVGETAALIGAVCGLLALLAAQFGVPQLVASVWPGSNFKIAWPWFALIGSSTTFLFGYLFGKLIPIETITPEFQRDAS